MTRPFTALSLTLAMLLPGPVLADRPSLEYFTGLYERVGRDAAGKLLNDFVRLDASGDSLAMTICPTTPSELTGPFTLRYSDASEVENFVSGKEGPFELWCQYFNDSQNYPILNCSSDGGALFTLWPQGSGSGCPNP
jgi:hypothetical protein